MTEPIGYTPISTVLTPQAPTPKSKTEMDKDTFLKLLVAQLKYQDPDKPVDSSAFMSQTAQFTQVEKLDDVATGQQQILAAQLAMTAASLIGRTVTYLGAAGKDVTGVVTAATIDAANPTLRVGAADVPLSAIKQVSAAGPAAPSNPTAPSNPAAPGGTTPSGGTTVPVPKGAA